MRKDNWIEHDLMLDPWLSKLISSNILLSSLLYFLNMSFQVQRLHEGLSDWHLEEGGKISSVADIHIVHCSQWRMDKVSWYNHIPLRRSLTVYCVEEYIMFSSISYFIEQVPNWRLLLKSDIYQWKIKLLHTNLSIIRGLGGINGI